MVLLILAVIWCAVLVPPWIQNRREHRPSDSIATFRQQLSVLQRATPGFEPAQAPAQYYAAPAGSAVTSLHAYRTPRQSPRTVGRHAALRRAETRKRRREVLVTLLAASGITFLMAVALGSPAVWALHVVVDVLLVGYVAMLIQLAQRGAEREAKVRYLPATNPARRPELLLRRSGS